MPEPVSDKGDVGTGVEKVSGDGVPEAANFYFSGGRAAAAP